MLGNIQGKVWGWTMPVFFGNNVEVNLIFFRHGAYCSKHLHRHKFNQFLCLSGSMDILVWKNDYDLVDTTSLGPNDMTTVAPGEQHRFYGVQEGMALEIYWTELDARDIVRENCGGVDTEVSLDDVLPDFHDPECIGEDCPHMPDIQAICQLFPDGSRGLCDFRLLRPYALLP